MPLGDAHRRRGYAPSGSGARVTDWGGLAGRSLWGPNPGGWAKICRALGAPEVIGIDGIVGVVIGVVVIGVVVIGVAVVIVVVVIGVGVVILIVIARCSLNP